MVDNRIYISIIILLFSTILGIDLLTRNEIDNTNHVQATELIGNVLEEETTTESTSTSTTTTSTSIVNNTTSTSKIITTTTTKRIDNYLTVSGYNKIYSLIKAKDTKYEALTNGNKYAVIDYRLDFTDRKIIIYGHSFNNGGGLFNYFQNYDNNKSFYNNHRYIEVGYNNKKYTYEIFSVYIVTANSDEDESMEYYYWYKYNNVKWDEVIKSYKSRSQYDTGVSVSGSDRILIIQTCSTNPSVAGKYYKANLLIMGKLIKEE